MAIAVCKDSVKSITWPRRALLRGALSSYIVASTLWRETGEEFRSLSYNDESSHASIKEYRTTDQMLSFEQWLS